MRIKTLALKTQIENEKGPLKVGNWDCEIGLWKTSWDARNAGAAVGECVQEWLADHQPLLGAENNGSESMF